MDLDPDVIEVPPPIPRTNKQPKQKQVIIHEVIDVDKYEDLSDVTILEEKVDTKNKGKAIKNNSDGYNKPKENLASLLSGLDDFSSDWIYEGAADEDYEDNIDLYSDDLMDFDEYGSLQAQFDNVDIPSGVEAPIPWLPGPVNDFIEKADNGSGSSVTTSQMPSNTAGSWTLEPVQVSKELGAISDSSPEMPMNYPNHPSGLQISSPWFFAQISPMSHPHAASPFFGGVCPPINPNNQGGTNSAYYPSFPTNVGGLNHPPVGAPQMSWFASKFSPLANHTGHSNFHAPFHGAHIPPEEGQPRTPKDVNVEDVLRKFQLFKRFTTVEDHSDHHYASCGSSTKQPPKTWAKKIQEEWRILENDLPDAIFVRVYETRMDLLRAVIVGAEGTPYHDGLFFFDVFFPSSYPNVPPNVYYHSGGLRLNPNLYSNGKVCLSLLGTWHGNKNEKWLPGVSTVLQVLVSIQALILNQKPFFNEPGYERLSGLPNGEMRSRQYNENTFILSLKTMVYTMRRPPKHFEDFVMGHFHTHARDILVACRAYMDGAQVGCLVKGGVQDVDEGDKSCSKSFKDSLPECVNLLMKEFLHIGVKDTENLHTAAELQNNGVVN